MAPDSRKPWARFLANRKRGLRNTTLPWVTRSNFRTNFSKPSLYCLRQAKEKNDSRTFRRKELAPFLPSKKHRPMVPGGPHPAKSNHRLYAVVAIDRPKHYNSFLTRKKIRAKPFTMPSICSRTIAAAFSFGP